MTEEARRLIKSIRQMEAALVDDKTDTDQDPDLSVTLPLRDCIASLKEKHATVSRIHRERYEQVKSRSLPLLLSKKSPH